MDKPDQRQRIYVVNAEQWKKFSAVRKFFADYLCDPPEDLGYLEEKELPTFEAAGISKKNITDTLAELSKWMRHYGNISGIKTPPETVDGMFTVEVNNIDFYDDTLKEFLEMLDIVDSLSVRNSGNDSVLIDVCVKDVWKVVEPHE